MSSPVAIYLPEFTGPSQEEMDAAEAVFQQYLVAVEAQVKQSLLECTTQAANGKGCGHLQRLGETTYIQTHWYVTPHGCTGGDYWKPGEGQFRCDACGKINRLYASPEIEKQKRFFKDVQDVHDN